MILSQVSSVTSPNTIILVVASVCSSGALVAVIQWLSSRGKSSAEEVEIWTRTSVTRLKTMAEQLIELESRVRALNLELESERRARVSQTTDLHHALALLVKNGIEWTPPGFGGEN